MSQSFDEVRQIAMELPYDDRRKLSEELWWSLHPPAEDIPQKEIDATWGDEIERRVSDIDSGSVEMIPGDQFLEKLRRRLPPNARSRPEK